MPTGTPALRPTGDARAPAAAGCRPVHGRRAFAELRRARARAVNGAVRVQFAPGPDGDEQVRVAYAVPKKVGGAVDRNRFRRRLRAIAAAHAGELAPGAYLVGVDERVRQLRFEELSDQMLDAMQRAARSAR